MVHCGGRGDDVLSFAVVNNMLSADARRYFAAGGLRILIGDGRLTNAGPEQIGEASYCFPIAKRVTATFDYQFVSNPALRCRRNPYSMSETSFESRGENDVLTLRLVGTDIGLFLASRHAQVARTALVIIEIFYVVAGSKCRTRAE